jgi:flagellar biosynthesis/type III secretory pathway protein FliH
MSSMQAVSWALDEFAMPDIFTAPAPQDAAPSSPIAEEEPVDIGALLAAERARTETEAYARGRADGERYARVAAESRLSTAVAALAEAVRDVRRHEARWVGNAEANVAALAVAVARHIVGREVAADPETVRALVTRALVGMPLDSAIVVRLHPDDMAACAALAVPETAGRTLDIRWTADPHIVRGGCMVEGRERIIDGRIDTSLERAYRSIGNIQA